MYCCDYYYYYAYYDSYYYYYYYYNHTYYSYDYYCNNDIFDTMFSSTSDRAMVASFGAEGHASCCTTFARNTKSCTVLAHRAPTSRSIARSTSAGSE